MVEVTRAPDVQWVPVGKAGERVTVGGLMSDLREADERYAALREASRRLVDSIRDHGDDFLQLTGEVEALLNKGGV